MFTHQQTLDAINAGLRALGRKELDGIPVAAPGHSEKCVLGCSFHAGLWSESGQGGIHFESAETAAKVRDAWRAAGVEVEEPTAVRGDDVVVFTGGLFEWMAAFDGGKWDELIVEGYADPDEPFDEYPGERTVPVAELPEVVA